MRSFIIQTIEELDGVHFLATLLFGEDGQRIDERVVLYEGDAAAAIFSAIEMKSIHRLATIPEYWTSTRQLMAAALSNVGIAATMKAAKDTQDAYRAVHDNADLLRELYTIEPPQQGTAEELGRVRRGFIRALEWTANLCERTIKLLKTSAASRKGDARQ